VPVDLFVYAKQIAEGLEAAHERGVIHRDLKPANIKIAPGEKVKVLDFGLAAVRESEVSSNAASQSPTMMSTPGMIMGTAGYMSPEQARGKTVDKRSDIFSFGCVLYEMLTGRQAFGGEDVPDILSRILQRDPDWTALPTDLSPQIGLLLRRCLEKDLTKRRRDIGDVRIDIEQALHEPASTTLSSRGVGRARLPWMLLSAAGLMIVALAALYIRRPSVDIPEVRVEINAPASRQPLHFALSPDGMRLAFVASGDGAQRLWVRSLDASGGWMTERPLPGTEEAEYPFWSPDSRYIGFFAGGELKRIDLIGGRPKPLADAPTGRGGAWNAEGTILFARTTTEPLWRVPDSGEGDPVQVTQLAPSQQSHRLPQFLPDGRRFLFSRRVAQKNRAYFSGHSTTKM
jgi:eukaryotic-like serine/threonine-protein kinase